MLLFEHTLLEILWGFKQREDSHKAKQLVSMSGYV